MIQQSKIIESKKVFGFLCVLGFVVIPSLYFMGVLSIGDINMLGRFMTFAILALGLDLLYKFYSFKCCHYVKYGNWNYCRCNVKEIK